MRNAEGVPRHEAEGPQRSTAKQSTAQHTRLVTCWEDAVALAGALTLIWFTAVIIYAIAVVIMAVAG
jgi:hypothetical protein